MPKLDEAHNIKFSNIELSSLEEDKEYEQSHQ